eukprot:5746374-Pyramimonas_sp.AAC.1
MHCDARVLLWLARARARRTAQGAQVAVAARDILHSLARARARERQGWRVAARAGGQVSDAARR